MKTCFCWESSLETLIIGDWGRLSNWLITGAPACIGKDKEGYQQDFMKRGANHQTSLIFRYFLFLDALASLETTQVSQAVSE